MTQNLGPRPANISEADSSAAPVAASPGQNFGAHSYARPLAGLATVIAIAAIVALSVGLFRGSFTKTVPVTVLSNRAGLVMNPDAKVKMRGVQVGKVASIEARPDGTAALHLAMEPDQLHLIPSNVAVDITSSTVFGAKFVQLDAPDNPSPENLRAGQVLEGKHVTVEVNTVFERLVSVMSSIEPVKLNETLGAMSKAFDGRGEKFGQAMTDFNALLAKLDPSLPNLSHDIQVTPDVVNAYADAAPDLLAAADNTTRISRTIVDQQANLDAFLVSSIGLAHIGNEVLTDNGQPLTDALHLLAPTTDLLNEYSPALDCGLHGVLTAAKTPPQPVPGGLVSNGLTLGIERYRYPKNLPKVAATGGPQCLNLPVPFEKTAPFLVTDSGANPWQYGNQGLLLNSDALKQFLFGPLDGPPRNTAQIGQPG
jgi:virulence factor Mce-like protein